MLEHHIEQAGIDHAEADGGWITRKMTYVGRHGCRDRDFYGYGHTIKVEFKRPGGKARPHQDRERNRLWDTARVRIHVIDSEAGIIALLDKAKANPRRDDLT